VTVTDLRDLVLPPVTELQQTSVSLPRRSDPVTVHAGDVLIAARGREPRVAIATAHSEGAIVSANLLLIRPGPALRPEVLLAFLLQPETQARLRALGRSSTGQLSLTAEAIGNLEVPVPAAAAQERVAVLVGTAAAYCRAAERASAERWQLALALAADVCRGTCNPPAAPSQGTSPSC
jgi:hypothetical protein